MTSEALFPGFYLLTNAHVCYEGRARAESKGETILVIVKADRSVICFDFEKGVRAKYYNASKELTITRTNGSVIIKSVNKKTETLSITGLVQSAEIVSTTGQDPRVLQAKVGTEHDLAEWVRANPRRFGLKKTDFVGMEATIMTGRIDLMFKDVIVEVKKKAGVRSFDQIYRYLRETNKKRGYIVCIHASKGLKEAAKKIKRVKIIEVPDWEPRVDELPKDTI